MSQEKNSPFTFDSLSHLHRVLGLPKPLHPMISLVNNSGNTIVSSLLPNPFILNFYKIAYKPNLRGKIRYGQRQYDFEEGGLFFVSPHQISGGSEDEQDHSGYTLLIDPAFLYGYPVAAKIKKYGFFSYAASEALHLSDKEKTTIVALFASMEDELNGRIDDFSQDVMISQLELLLNYANRFYKRQFITRKSETPAMLEKLEQLLAHYFDQEMPVQHGLPTVRYLSNKLNISASYLSDMLRSLTGQNAQQHIHQVLIEQAKEKLTTSSLSVSEIAYGLGFEHSQSFSNLFKKKTSLSPLEFRQAFQ